MGAKTMTRLRKSYGEQATHTPGPWVISCDSHGWHVDTQDWAADALPKADAYLVAAAPDMLAALIALVRASDGHPGSVRERDVARAVIAKADLSAIALAKAEGEKS